MRRDVFALSLIALLLIGAPWFTTFALARSVPREVLSLDGTWEIIFDPVNKGREAGWHRDKTFSSVAGRREIVVPSCWELTERDYEGVAFYRRKFRIPASWKGEEIDSVPVMFHEYLPYGTESDGCSFLAYGEDHGMLRDTVGKLE